MQLNWNSFGLREYVFYKCLCDWIVPTSFVLRENVLPFCGWEAKHLHYCPLGAAQPFCPEHQNHPLWKQLSGCNLWLQNLLHSQHSASFGLPELPDMMNKTFLLILAIKFPLAAIFCLISISKDPLQNSKFHTLRHKMLYLS